MTSVIENTAQIVSVLSITYTTCATLDYAKICHARAINPNYASSGFSVNGRFKGFFMSCTLIRY